MAPDNLGVIFYAKGVHIDNMIGTNRFIFLSDNFYEQYTEELFPEIERKKDRPYIQIHISIDGVHFAIPLRSNIHHPFAFMTDAENNCGIDFSKAIVISDESYINHDTIPHIRQNEFDALRGKDYIIEQKMRRYIKKYKNAKNNMDNARNRMMVQRSTLQYFESEIENITL